MQKFFFTIAIYFASSLTLRAQQDTSVMAVPGLLAFQNLRDYCLRADGNEDFFTIQSPNGEISQIATRIKNNGAWSAPSLLSFCDAFIYMEPFLSADGLTLYFVSDRPLQDTGTIQKDYDIWFVKRVNFNSPWSAPINMGAPVNSTNDEFYPSLTTTGDLYFTMAAPTGMGKDDIYMCAFADGKYSVPQILPAPINSSGYEFNAYISPDGNTLIYTKYNAPGGYGSGDLYIAHKDASGNWSEAKNMGEKLNSMYMEYCPYYHYPTSTLYFTSRRSTLEPRKFESVADLQTYISGKENGSSRLYYQKMILQ
jgi:hypothetical protein